jgi:predicted Zn-dependent protease
MLAQALLADSSKNGAREALSMLSQAEKYEDDSASLHLYKARAHAILGDYARAELSTAESAMLRGDKKLAEQKANGAKKQSKSGSPVWIRANDILNALSNKG